MVQNRSRRFFRSRVFQLGRTGSGSANGLPYRSLVEPSPRFPVGLDGWRLSIQLWKENPLDVVWGTACSLLAGFASPQWHSSVLLALELCVIF